MNVPSPQFFAFSAVIALVINLSGRARWRQSVLLIADVAFFASFASDPRQFVPFAALLALGFVLMRMLERVKQQRALVGSLAAVLLLFCWLKSYSFIPTRLLLQYPFVTVGMSYVFFRMMQLCIDAYQGTARSAVGLLSYLTYTLNFTTLVSGPIQSYVQYRRTETEHPLPLDADAVGRALERIAIGLFKVSILSPLFGALHDRTLADALSVGSVVATATAIAAFPLYLYANFSGYTDVVVGVARFLRLDLPENFNRPFAAEGFIDFWNRWHITLSAWLRTYVYSPLMLGLMRRIPAKRAEPFLAVFTYFVTFFLIGLWHGRTLGFVIFGIFNGIGVSVNKIFELVTIGRIGRKGYRSLCARPIFAVCSRGVTVAWFAITLVWFWISPAQLAEATRDISPTAIALAVALVVAASTFATFAAIRVWSAIARISLAGAAMISAVSVRTVWSTLLVVAVLTADVVFNAPAPRIVYQAF